MENLLPYWELNDSSRYFDTCWDHENTEHTATDAAHYVSSMLAEDERQYVKAAAEDFAQAKFEERFGAPRVR